MRNSRQLNIPGENEFRNKGVAYCATCDGPLFAGKDVAVIGGGNSALEAVLQLVKIARHIYLINNTLQLTGDPIMQEKIASFSHVTVLNNSTVSAITGSRFVESISGAFDGERRTLPVEGVFIEIGLIPNSEFESGLQKNKSGEVHINAFNETNIPGVFAAGDVTDVPEKQIIIAAGEGAKAALRAFQYLALMRDPG